MAYEPVSSDFVFMLGLSVRIAQMCGKTGVAGKAKVLLTIKHS